MPKPVLTAGRAALGEAPTDANPCDQVRVDRGDAWAIVADAPSANPGLKGGSFWNEPSRNDEHSSGSRPDAVVELAAGERIAVVFDSDVSTAEVAAAISRIEQRLSAINANEDIDLATVAALVRELRNLRMTAVDPARHLPRQ